MTIDDVFYIFICLYFGIEMQKGLIHSCDREWRAKGIPRSMDGFERKIFSRQ